MQTVIALGFFDGVHLGHGALLRRAAEAAARDGLRSCALTFDRSPGKDGRLLTSVEDRVRLIRDLYHIDRVEVLPFTEDFMRMPWDVFLEGLVRDYGAVRLICGWDYRFGYLGQGDPTLLRQWCLLHGVACDVVDKLVMDGITVSSTFLKALIESGDTETAIRYYGHPHTLTGLVQPGRRLGHTLGFPTANLLPDSTLLLPRRGVYAVRGTVEGRTYTGVCNIGTRPTVDGRDQTVETWLADFDGDLYGKALRVDFYRCLREEIRFPDLEALRAEIFRNQDQSRAYFAALDASEGSPIPSGG